MKSKIFGLLLVITSLSLHGCAFTVAETAADSKISSQNIATNVVPVSVISPQSEAENNVPTTTITRYKVDDQCQNLIPMDLAVPKEKSMEKAVEKIIGDRSNGDFRIAGYRLHLDPVTKIATINLRLPPDSARTINSLSHCEQFAFFGELRATLTKNKAWAIKTVQFQIQGKEILF